MAHEEYNATGEATVQSAVPAPEERPRSGYARLRQRHRHLIAEHEALLADYGKLRRELEALKAGHAELQAAFDELLQIHNGLLGDLKQSHQVRSAISGSPSNLMGRHG